jgi:hypothetical protein
MSRTFLGGTVCIYFIRPVGSDGPVKIGHSCYPASRLLTYLAWSPVPLEIAAVIELAVPDGRARRRYAMSFERRFHNRYRDHWSHHEWFNAHPQLTRDIQLIRDNRFQLSCLPESGPPIRKGTDSAWHQGRTAPRQVAA